MIIIELQSEYVVRLEQPSSVPYVTSSSTHSIHLHVLYINMACFTRTKPTDRSAPYKSHAMHSPFSCIHAFLFPLFKYFIWELDVFDRVGSQDQISSFLGHHYGRGASVATGNTGHYRSIHHTQVFCALHPASSKKGCFTVSSELKGLGVS